MTFLRPEFLWALFVLTIPIIIHLFSFRRKRIVYFSNTRFIKQIQEETTSLKKIKQYLILAARMLFLFFLVLAFSQPFIPATKQENAGTPVVLYVDNSYSMTLQNGASTLLEQAVAYAQNVIEAFPKDSKFILLTNSNQNLRAKTGKEISDELAQLKATADTKKFDKVLLKATEWKNTDAFFVLSDFQKQQFHEIQKDSTSYLLVPFQKQNTSNIFFDSLYLQNPFLVQGEKNKITCSLFNSGTDNRSQVLVKLFIDDLQVGSVSTDIGANKKADIVFELPEGLQGLKRGRVAVQDSGNVFDNDFYLSLDYSTKINVVELKSSSVENYIQKVFANENLFQFQTYRETNVNFEEAERADLLILNEINSLNDALYNITQSILNKGGSVLVIPSDQINVSSFQKILPQVKSQSLVLQLPIKKIDFSNSFFSNVFESKLENIDLPSAQPVINVGAAGINLLSFSNDQAFLNIQNARGKLYTFSSPLRLPFTNFSTNALFVPVMYKMATLSKTEAKALYQQEDVFSIKVDGSYNRNKNTLVKLIGKDEIIPEQRTLNNQVMFDLQGLSISPGNYWLMAEKDTIGLFAKNIATTESYLDFIEKEELINHFGNQANILSAENNSVPAIQDLIVKNYQGKPLWKLALILSLLFLLAEMALIKFLP